MKQYQMTEPYNKFSFFLLEKGSPHVWSPYLKMFSDILF